MKALLQRVSGAAVAIEASFVRRIGLGLVIFIGIEKGDTKEDVEYLRDKALNLRIFPDDSRDFEKSALNIGADLLIVSQFTLAANSRKGRRPSFVQAANQKIAEPLVDLFANLCAESGLRVTTGEFRAHMQVEIHNDGPVTIWLDSFERDVPRRR